MLKGQDVSVVERVPRAFGTAWFAKDPQAHHLEHAAPGGVTEASGRGRNELGRDIKGSFEALELFSGAAHMDLIATCADTQARWGTQASFRPTCGFQPRTGSKTTVRQPPPPPPPGFSFRTFGFLGSSSIAVAVQTFPPPKKKLPRARNYSEARKPSQCFRDGRGGHLPLSDEESLSLEAVEEEEFDLTECAIHQAEGVLELGGRGELEGIGRLGGGLGMGGTPRTPRKERGGGIIIVFVACEGCVLTFS